MSAVETRNANRDSLYIMGTMNIEGVDGLSRAKIRNLSSRGAMAETSEDVACGTRVKLELREIGDVQGIVAWVEGNRIGIAFDREIDPQRARAAHSAVQTAAHSSREVVRRPAGALARPYDGKALRAV